MEKIKESDLEYLKEGMKANFNGIVTRCFNELTLNKGMSKKDVYDELKLKVNYEVCRYLAYQFPND